MSWWLLTMMGCAPPSSLPPPIPLASSHTVGLAVSGGYTDTIGSKRPRPPGIDLAFAQGSVSFRAGDRLQLSILGSGSGLAHFSGVGLLARYRLDGEDDESALALQLEGGLFWLGAGLVWRRDLGPAWVYAAPSILYKDSPWARLPAGVQVSVSERASVALEAGITTSTTRLRPDNPQGPVAHGYIGTSLGFALGAR